MQSVQDILSALEGTEHLLYSDPNNPYESITIRARISGGLLTLADDECDYGPDGGWSHRTLSFDRENTEKALLLLLERNPDPIEALRGMTGYSDRTKRFQSACQARGIDYKTALSF